LRTPSNGGSNPPRRSTFQVPSSLRSTLTFWVGAFLIRSFQNAFSAEP
jgi:hypothetical protein